LYAFRGTTPNEKVHRFGLKGLERSARYRLQYYDHSFADRIVTGRELMDSGLKLTLSSPNNSELIFIDNEE
jgi:Glycosyl hydrolase family 36 C-terminal domain